MERFIEAVILALVFEGVIFALFPTTVRLAMLKALMMTDQQLRATGGLALASAIILALALKWFA